MIRQITDQEAMSKIHQLMNGTEWDSQTLDDIAGVVQQTGRGIDPPREEISAIMERALIVLRKES